MKVLVTGSNGLLGQKLCALAPSQAEVFGVDLHSPSRILPQAAFAAIDLGDREAIVEFTTNVKPAWIINAAGYTNVDGAETERDLCWRANVTAVENLIVAARKAKAKIVQLSTDYIFDGERGPYDEEAVPNPLGFYGRSKLAAENALHLSRIEFAVVRTMILYGKANGVRPNFVSWVIEKLRHSEEIKAVTDQLGNTTLADELAIGIWKIVESTALGTYHLAGREIVNRFSFAQKIAEVFGLDSGLIKPATTPELRQAAPRPMNSGLIIDKARRDLRVEFSDVEGGLLKLKKQGYP